MSRVLTVLLLVLPVCAAGAQGNVARPGWWGGVGLGGGAFESLTPAPSAGRGAVAASIELGYRLTPRFGLGVEAGTIAPVSGCRDLQCGEAAADFAPSFNRLFAFGEFRSRHSGLRLRAGVGMSRFCYERHWDENAWSMFDTLMVVIDEDYLYETDGTGAWRCDASSKAIGGAVSVGYDWQAGRGAPLSVGVRLTGEAARFSATPGTGMPAFRHRAVMLSIHLRVN